MNQSKEEFLEKAKEVALKGLPFALFSYPNSADIQLIYQNDDTLYTTNLCEGDGFIMCPFHGGAPLLLKQEHHLTTPLFSVEKPILSADLIPIQGDRTLYHTLFEKALKAIEEHTLEKVVLSRRIAYQGNQKSLLTYFQDLKALYPTAFCYAFSHPKVGRWLAATPETLIKVVGDTLCTMSLAGTKPFVEGESPLWTEKEYREQKIVTDTITQVLHPLTTDLSIGKVHEVRAGRLWHLCTEITTKIAPNTPIQEIVQRLHPTPAVCGFPTDKARHFLLDNEGYPREFYAGYCGLTHWGAHRSIDLFVNLRCAQLNQKEIFVYVGGGVNSGSQEESEWQETENKAQTMLRVLQ